MKTIRIAFVFLGLCGAAWAAVPVDFAHLRKLSGPESPTARLAEARVDAALLAATRTGFPDLRIFDGEFREIPFLIAPLVAPKARTQRQAIQARIGEIVERTGNRFDIRCDLDPDSPDASALDIRSPGRDYIRQVRVTGSRDGQLWMALCESEIYDYSQVLDVRRTFVTLPTNSCRTFKIEITSVPDERVEPFIRLAKAEHHDPLQAARLNRNPFQVNGIGFWHTPLETMSDEPVLQEWVPMGSHTTQDHEASTTEYFLETMRTPVTQIEFATSAKSFSRIATVLVPDGERWNPVADGILRRIITPEFATNVLTLRFPEQRADRLRIVIQHADEPKMKFSSLRTFGPTYRIVWRVEPGARYHIAYGNETIEGDAGDASPIRAALASGQIPARWILAPPSVLPSAPPNEAAATQRRYFIGGIILALLLLGDLILTRRRNKKQK